MSGAAELEVVLRADSEEARLVLQGPALELQRSDRTVDLRAAVLRYEERTFGDRLTVDGTTWSVPRGRGADTLRAIALGRLRSPNEAPLALPVDAPLLAKRTELETAWLGGWLEPGERVLSWLRTVTSLDVESPIFGAAPSVEARLVLTTQRAALVAISHAGDVRVELLPAATPKISRSLGRAQVDAGGVRVMSELGNASEVEAVATLLPSSAADRGLEIARLCAREGSDLGRARSTLVLSQLVEDGDPWAAIAARYREASVSVGDDTLARAIEAVVKDPAAGQKLVSWWVDWEATVEQGMSVVDRLRVLGTEDALAAAAELRGRVREALLDGKKDAVELAALDHEHALLLREAGRRDDARALLEERLTALPEPELLDLVPHPDEDPTEDGQAIRVRLLTELVTLRGEDGRPDASTLAEIARLQPLNADRVRALRDAADGSLALRAAELLSILEPGALGAASDARPPAVRALGEELLLDTLRHPVAREGHALGKLQAALAQVEVPDHGALRSYCQKLARDDDVVLGALTDAVVALGVSGVEGYISRGDKSVGVRAYEGEPSFLLIGGNHLTDGAAERLSPCELRFAIGAEVAHLRFEHARVTSSELWAGAFEKGKATLDTLLSVVPVLGFFKWGERAAIVAGHLGSDAAKSAIGLVGRVVGKKEQPKVDPALGVDTGQLLAAHRAMQFTADRAGLLLAGDLRAAIRAVFLTWPIHGAELPVVDRLGLRAGLSRREADGELMHPDLAVRICALLSFHLDDDYETLRAAATP